MHCLRLQNTFAKIKKRMLFRSFIISQFNYCPLVWMCHGRCLSNKINKTYERALRIVYQDKKSSFKTLFKRDKSTSIHLKNHQYNATELFKLKNYLSPEIVKEILFLKKMKLTVERVVIIQLERTYEQRDMELRMFQIQGLNSI